MRAIPTNATKAALVVTALVAFAAFDAPCQQQRTFVASYGTDANACKVSAPCATFAAAAAHTLDGGEIVALDSGEYGVVTVTQSLAIIAPRGVRAAISASFGTAVSVNTPSARVRLEGLAIEGSGGGATGIGVDRADLFVVERCTITGFSGDGVRAGTNAVRLLVHDTVIADNNVGINVDSPSTLVVEHSRVVHNFWGLVLKSGGTTVAKSTIAFNGEGVFVFAAAGSAKLAVTDTVINENYDGIQVTAAGGSSVALSVSATKLRYNANRGLGIDVTTGATVVADVEHSAISDHSPATGQGAGIAASNASGTVKMTLSNNTITRNGTGVANAGALIESLGNNTFDYNGTNGGPLAAFAPL